VYLTAGCAPRPVIRGELGLSLSSKFRWIATPDYPRGSFNLAGYQPIHRFTSRFFFSFPLNPEAVPFLVDSSSERMRINANPL